MARRLDGPGEDGRAQIADMSGRHPAETPTAVKAATKKRTANKAAANDSSPGREVRTIIYIEARPKAGRKGALSGAMSSRSKGSRPEDIKDSGRGDHLGEE